MFASKIEDPTPKLRRRDVLVAGAGLALLPSSVHGAWRRAPGLAVGYCREPLAGEAVRVTAASRLAAGEAELARQGARVTVEGLVGGESLRRLGLRSAELKVGFPVAGVEPAEVEYRAWSWELEPVEQTGSPVRFTVPVDAGLALALEVEGWGSERYEAVLTTGREAGRPKLRPGRYLIAPGAPEFRPRRHDPARGEPLLALSVEAAPA